MISSAQLKAARALLDWNQKTLAERAGVTQATIANIEIGKHLPSRTTLEAINGVFESVGIEILPDGIRKLKGIREFSGEEAFKRLLEDAYYVLKKSKDELLIGGGDERQNRPGVDKVVHKIRQAGVRMRVLVEQGNRHLLAPLNEYRCVPSKYFINNPTIIYGDRVAVVIPEKKRDFIQVFVNPTLADSQRRLFNFLWDHCTQPERSDVTQVFF